MTLTIPPRGVELILLPIVTIAAVYDIRYRRIPNWLNVAGVLLGLAMNAWLGAEGRIWPGLWFSLQGLGLAFAVYFLLYAVRAMGAGDVKMMAAVGALVGWEDWVGIFILTALIGGVTAILFALVRGRLKNTLFNVGFILSEFRSGRPAYLKNQDLDVKSSKALRQPHGAIIAVATWCFIALGAYFTR